MSLDLQQSLAELQTAFDAPGGSKDDVTKLITQLKVSSFARELQLTIQIKLAQSGLYFAPPDANPQDLLAARELTM